MDDSTGDVLISADLAGTAVFAITAALAAVFFTTFWQWVASVTALALFGVGVFAFLWSYYNAVQRSRRDEIGVANLYLLLGPPIPPRVRRIMLSLLLLQLVIAVVTTFARLEGPTASPARRSPSASSCRCSASASTGCGPPTTATSPVGPSPSDILTTPPTRRRGHHRDLVVAE